MQDYQKITFAEASPRAILQIARTNNFISIDELKALLAAVSDRNLTSHAYEEELADEIASRIPEHYSVLQYVIARLTIPKLILPL